MKNILLSSFVFMTLLLGGCDSDDSITAPTIESLDITPKARTLDIGTTQKYTAFAKYSDNSYEDVSDQVIWSLANDNGSIIFDQVDPSIARAAAVGTDFVVAKIGTTPPALGSITTTDSQRAEVTVVDDTLISILITPENSDLIIGVDHQFTATGTYSEGRTQDLTEESDWTSGNTNFVTISGNGLATSLAEGQTTISASFDGQADIVNVSVNDPNKIDQIVITPEGYDFLTGDLKQFNAYAYFIDQTKEIENITKQCTWGSSDTSLVALVLGVNARDGYFEAKDRVGDAIITATYNINHNSTIKVTVDKPGVSGIVITPSVVTLSVGEDMQFITYAVDQDNKLHSINTNPNQVYTVDNPSIISVANDPDNAGTATALSVGQTVITSIFEYEGITHKTLALVTVTQ
jgi:hypothetical protein